MTTSQPIESPETVWEVPRQPAALSCFKLGGIVVASALFAVLFVRVAGALAAGSSALPVLPGLLLGYLMADLLSGTAHWFCDSFFEEDTPVIGQIVIQPFRDHHVHPQRITRYRFVEQDTTNFFLMLPLLAAAFWLGVPRGGSVAELFWCCALLGLSAGSFGTNLFHKWAHEQQPPLAVRWLQRVGLILAPDRHQRHHHDHSRAFCVTSGWLNPLLDSMRFFQSIERLLRRIQA